MAGVRIDNIQPTGIFSTNGSINIDPRLNIRYNILNRNNNSFFKELNIRAGYGQNSKAPTLTYLYPDKRYFDVVGFNYYPELIVSTTKVIEDTRNYDLKPATSNKYEVGIDFKVKKSRGSVTAFYEKHQGGFISDRIMYPLQYRDYNTIDAGLSPYYAPNEGIYYDDPNTGETIAVGYEDDETFKSYSVYRNASVRIKRGLEYSLDLGTIKSLRTSLNIIGAWFQTESYEEDAPYWVEEHYTEYIGNTSKQESFAVKFPDHHGYSRIKERLNTSFNIINHIPELKMVISLNMQVIWFEKDWRKIYPEKSLLLSLTELRDYLNIPDLFTYEEEDDFYYYLPVSYKYYDNIEYEYTIVDFEEDLNQQAIKKDLKYRYDKRVLPTLLKCDIKISKDIGDRFKTIFLCQ